MNIRNLGRVGCLAALAVATSLGAGANTANSQAVSTTFTSQIIYQNPTSSAGNLTASFYAEKNGSPAATISVPVAVPGYGSGSILVGSVAGLPGAFKGSAVLSADFDVLASTIQVPNITTTNRILATGFRSSDATSDLYLPTFLNGAFSTKSSFAVQNVEAQSVDITATFRSVGGLVYVYTDTLPASSSRFFDSRTASTIPGMISGFNGSARVVAVKSGTATPANVVGTAEEYLSTDGRAYGYEAVPFASSSATIYLPTAQCNYQPVQQNSLSVFAFQNTSAFTVSATVHWLNTANVEVGNQVYANIGPGAKASMNTCTASGVPNPGFLGSGYITVGSGGKGVVVGKIQATVPGFQTGFLGQGQGSPRLAFPYIRYGATPLVTGDMVSSISVQNIGASPVATGTLSLAFYDLNGTLVRSGVTSSALGVGSKVSFNLATASNAQLTMSGSVPPAGFEGSLIVTGPPGSQLISVSRHQQINNLFWTEDYNGILLP